MLLIKRMSRRQFLQQVLGGTAATIVLSACQGTSPSPSGTAVQQTPGAAAKTAAKGGDLIFGLSSEPPTLDPHNSGSAWTPRVDNSIFDTLVWKAADQSFKPFLATKWEPSADGKTWTFNLKQGVKFHDGTPFDANAVKYNFDRVIDPKRGGGSSVGLLGPYEGADIVDAHTIRVRFKSAFAPLLDGLSQSFLGMVSPTAADKLGDNFGAQPVGTGPFVFKEWVRQDHITLTRNADYQWAAEGQDHTGPAYLASVVFKFIPEAATRVATLETGETHIIENVPAQEVGNIQKDNKFQVVLTPIPGMPWLLDINIKQPPTDDLNVRKALIYAVNQKAMVDTLFPGLYDPSTNILTAVTWSYDKKAASMYSYSKEKARELLDQAGWKMGSGGIREKDGKPLALSMHVIAAAGYDETAQLLQSQYRESGIQADIKLLERATMFNESHAGKHHLANHFWVGSDPDILQLHFHSSMLSTWNWQKISDPAMDKLLDDGRSTVDEAKRKAIYAQIQQKIMEEALIVPIFDHKNLTAARNQIKGMRFDVRTYPWLYDAYIEG